MSSSTLVRFLQAVVLTVLAVVIIAGLIGWLAGWRTLHQFGVGLMWGGIAGMAFGCSSLFGSASLSSDSTYRWQQSFTPGNFNDLFRQDIRDLRSSSWFLMVLGTAGLVAVVLGVVMQSAFV